MKSCKRALDTRAREVVLLAMRALLAIGPLSASGTVIAAEADAGLVIRDVTVISPERSAPLEHAYVRVESGRITEVSSQPLKGHRGIEGHGKFLVPGLIDTHVHLRVLKPMTREQQAALRDLVAAADAQEPRSYLYFGFTTVLSLGDMAEPIRRWNAQEVRPDAYFCGKTPMLNGYSFMGGVEGSPYFLYNPDQAASVPASVNEADHTPAAVIARMARDGAICVKTYHESGFGRDAGRLPTPSREMMKTLIAAAHAKNMPVFMHANSLRAQQFAVEAGADVIAHGLWNGYAMENDALPNNVRAHLQNVAKRGVGFQPTTWVIRGLRAELDPSYLKGSLLVHAYPAALLAWFSTKEAAWFREEELGGVPPAALEGVSRGGDAVIAWLNQSNGRLVFGTDTPSAPVYTNPPGLNGFNELRVWSSAGVSLSRILRAATIDNARLMRLDREIGTVEKGKKANLLLLRADPLKSVEAYNSIETVFLAGRPLDRELLSARNASNR